MKILKSNDTLPNGVAIALGAFDGIHMGHRKLIENIVDYSKYNGCSSCVYTFDTLPSGAKYITDWEQRIKIFESLGVDYLYIHKTNNHCILNNQLYSQLVFCVPYVCRQMHQVQ